MSRILLGARNTLRANLIGVLVLISLVQGCAQRSATSQEDSPLAKVEEEDVKLAERGSAIAAAATIWLEVNEENGQPRAKFVRPNSLARVHDGFLELSTLKLLLKTLTNEEHRVVVSAEAMQFPYGAVSNVVTSLHNEGFTHVDVLLLGWGRAYPVPISEVRAPHQSANE